MKSTISECLLMKHHQDFIFNLTNCCQLLLSSITVPHLHVFRTQLSSFAKIISWLFGETSKLWFTHKMVMEQIIKTSFSCFNIICSTHHHHHHHHGCLWPVSGHRLLTRQHNVFFFFKGASPLPNPPSSSSSSSYLGLGPAMAEFFSLSTFLQ